MGRRHVLRTGKMSRAAKVITAAILTVVWFIAASAYLSAPFTSHRKRLFDAEVLVGSEQTFVSLVVQHERIRTTRWTALVNQVRVWPKYDERTTRSTVSVIVIGPNGPHVHEIKDLEAPGPAVPIEGTIYVPERRGFRTGNVIMRMFEVSPGEVCEVDTAESERLWARVPRPLGNYIESLGMTRHSYGQITASPGVPKCVRCAKGGTTVDVCFQWDRATVTGRNDIARVCVVENGKETELWSLESSEND